MFPQVSGTMTSALVTFLLLCCNILIKTTYVRKGLFGHMVFEGEKFIMTASRRHDSRKKLRDHIFKFSQEGERTI